MFKTSLLILYLFITVCASGQVVVVDNKTLEPIPFVHIISNNGKLFTTSNLKGVIDNVNRVEEHDTISIYHIAYNSQEILRLNLIDTIKMNRRDYGISEINVKPLNSKNSYLMVKGYFRSYQVENNIPKYYTDGIVEYYIPRGSGKGLLNRVLQCRSFRNIELELKDKERVNTVKLVAAGIPYIEEKTVIENLNKHHSIVLDSNSFEWDIIGNDQRFGTIRKVENENDFQICIDQIEKIKEKTIFKYTSRIEKIEITENYHSQRIDLIEKSQLDSRKEYRKIFFKHKTDLNFAEVDVIHEFYVQSIDYLYKSELKGIETSNFFGLPKEPNYRENYWEKYSSTFPKSLNNWLNRKLVSY